jgi:hypothetical protein
MQIIGYAPNRPGPHVPRFILTPNGLFDRDNHPADGQAVYTHEFSISEHEWIGVLSDGSIETFRRSEENFWRAKAAQNAINQIRNPKEDPEGTLRILRAAADIIGFDLPVLMQQLEKNKKSGESLVDTWLRTKNTKD